MTECTRCGDCCDPVFLGADACDVVFGRLTGGFSSQPVWVRQHLTFRRFVPHGAEFTCSYFDNGTRLCTAHEQRPKMCSEYPFYGRPPALDATMGGRCSFIADVPGVVMLPLLEVRHNAPAGASSPV